MKITIAGEEFKLHFGVAFINSVDKEYFVDGGTVQFGIGVNTVWLKLKDGDAWALYQALKGAIVGKHDLTPDEFDEWVDGLSSEEEFESFFEKLAIELEQARQTGILIEKYKVTRKKLEKQALAKVQEATKKD